MCSHQAPWRTMRGMGAAQGAPGRAPAFPGFPGHLGLHCTGASGPAGLAPFPASSRALHLFQPPVDLASGGLPDRRALGYASEHQTSGPSGVERPRRPLFLKGPGMTVPSVGICACACVCVRERVCVYTDGAYIFSKLSLSLRSANCGPWAKSGPRFVFVNKVLLAHSNTTLATFARPQQD